MFQKRYVIAATVACLVLAAGAAFCAHTRRSFVRHMQQKIADPQNAEEISRESATMLDQGVILPSSMVWRIDIADLLAGLWYIWVIVTFSACFAVAYFVGGQK